MGDNSLRNINTTIAKLKQPATIDKLQNETANRPNMIIVKFIEKYPLNKNIYNKFLKKLDESDISLDRKIIVYQYLSYINNNYVIEYIINKFTENESIINKFIENQSIDNESKILIITHIYKIFDEKNNNNNNNNNTILDIKNNIYKLEQTINEISGLFQQYSKNLNNPTKNNTEKFNECKAKIESYIKIIKENNKQYIKNLNQTITRDNIELIKNLILSQINAEITKLKATPEYTKMTNLNKKKDEINKKKILIKKSLNNYYFTLIFEKINKLFKKII